MKAQSSEHELKNNNNYNSNNNNINNEKVFGYINSDRFD
jgi:hypothetical protein